MHSTSAPETKTRTAIPPYPRADSAPLARPSLSAETSAVIADRRMRWAPYLAGAAHREAPLATRFLPILAGDCAIDDGEIAWPATLYPAGFRNQVLTHCAIEPATSWVEEARRPDGVVHRMRCGRGLLAESDDWSGERRLRLALTLNVLSLYRATVELLGRYGRSFDRDPHLTYEVVRAAYQIGGMKRAVQALGALSSTRCPSLPIRLNAASRLIAHYARSGDDLQECGRWVERATAILPGHGTIGEADFATGMAASRVYRAIALYASRRREAAWVIETLHAAEAANDRLEPLVDNELRRLDLQQNERLILEAALKAYTASAGRVDPLGALVSAARLTALDAWDPYTRLTLGDAYWILEEDGRALESYDIAIRMGTIVGAHAAHRAAVLLARTGRLAEAKVWHARAVELDPAAAAAGLAGG